MLHDLSHDKPGDSRADAPAADEQIARQQAIQQIERRRRFWFRANDEGNSNEHRSQTPRCAASYLLMPLQMTTTAAPAGSQEPAETPR